MELGFFRGDSWEHLVKACEISDGFKLFFFSSGEGELRLVVIGFGHTEVIFGWSKTYFRLD